MGDILDLTSRLKQKRWSAQEGRALTSLWIKTYELAVLQYEQIKGLVDTNASIAEQLPSFVLMRFGTYVADEIVALGEELYSASEIDETLPGRLSIAAAMTKELAIMIRDLPKKNKFYKTLH